MLSMSRSLARPTVFVRYNPGDYQPGGDDRDISPPEPLSFRERTLVYWVKRLLWTPRTAPGAEVLYLFFDGYTPGREKLKALGT